MFLLQNILNSNEFIIHSVPDEYGRQSIFAHSRPDPESIRDGTPRDPDKNRDKSAKIICLPRVYGKLKN